ncbi:MAG TPA: PEP-utilizing enzyme [Candidatus Nanoarchaeia archaeon]|nr:PEP-utilizing enzyme [Candidatus Nanoarchaeia archaeon]
MNNDWYEGAARELSFFTTTEIIKAYTSMQKKYGIAFYSVLFHSKKGVLRMIRKKSELNAIIDFIEHQSEEFVIGQFKKALSLYEKLKKALQKKALTQGKFQKVISLCEELWAYNMFCIYFTYATERKRVKEISGRNYALVAKVRNEICNVLILERFLRHQKIDLSELNGREIQLYLDKKELPDEKELKERREEYLIFMQDLKATRIPRSKIQSTLIHYIEDADYTHLRELKGIVAFKGNVSGPARIILRKKDLHLLKKGEILVTLSTSPDFVPYLLKSVGIVTDYGGVVSHAAIIAREEKIPCIVGTKIATKVFKNGDFVEVDANKGVVRKIK